MAATASSYQCRMIFSGKPTDWHSTGGGLFDDLRENAFHYMNWVKNSAKENIPQDLLADGQTAGDAHILNFSDLLINGKRKLRLNDKDDSGLGLFLFDFVRFATTVKAQRLGLETVDLFMSYRQGLLEEKKDKPKFLEKILETSKKDEAEAHKEYLEKYTQGKKFIFSDETSLVEISKSPESAQKIYREDVQKLKRELNSYTILDEAYRVKTSGGSRNQARFWFLVKDNNDEKHIIEFKLSGEPATSLVRKQKDFVNRMKDVEEVYWKGEKDPLYRAIRIGERDYYMRPKMKEFVNFKKIESEKDKEQAREFLLHVAYHMGRMVADQNPTSYIQAIVGEPENSFRWVHRLVNEYITLVKDL